MSYKRDDLFEEAREERYKRQEYFKKKNKERIQEIEEEFDKKIEDYERGAKGELPQKKKSKLEEIDSDDLLKWHKRKEVKNILGIVGILILFLGLFFLSPNITGSVVGNSSQNNNWIGGILFVLGLVGVYFWRKY